MTNFEKSTRTQLYLFIFSTTILLMALSTQYLFKLYPCTYCILARHVITITAFFSLFSYLISTYINHKRSILKERKISLYEKASALLMGLIPLNIIAGFYIAYHHYVVVFKQDFTCGVDELQDSINDMFLAKNFPAMYEATGNCVDANYKLFNLIDYVHLPIIVYIITLLFVIIYFKQFLRRNN